MDLVKNNTGVAIKWFEAFNTKNIESLLNLYSDSAKHYSPKLKLKHPETNGLITGKDALRKWWQDAFERLPSLHYKVVKLTASNEQIFMEYIRKVDGEEDLYVGEILVIENGLIVASRVFHS